MVAVTYIGALAALFRIYGGPVDALSDFLKYSQEIAAGFSSQMASAGPPAEVATLSAVLAIAVIATATAVLFRARCAPTLLIILFPLFVLFKSAIVRHDTGHTVTSCPAIVGLTGLLLVGRLGRWHSRVAQAVVFLAIAGASWFAPTSIPNLLASGATNWANLCNYRATRANSRRVSSQAVTRKLQLPGAMLARIGHATVDVYPWDICYAAAYRLNWKPRFVFQSYSAYTPDLDRRSAANYLGKNAPAHVLYSHKAIDQEHPCIVDPRTWMELFRRYDVVDQGKDMLLLERRTSPRWDRVEKLGTRSIAFGDRWELPTGVAGMRLLLRQVNGEISPLGRLTESLYKVYPPVIHVEYADGSTAKHRLSWRNAESGFLISSLPKELSGVRRLFENRESDRVSAVSFHDQGGFEQEFQISWYRVPMPVTPDSQNAAPRIAAHEMSSDRGDARRR